MIFPILLTIRTEDPAVMALRALPELHARVTYLSTREKRLESTEIDVDSSRGGVAARLVKRPEHGNDRQDVRYWATGNNLRAYDAVNEEWLSRPLRGGGSPIAKLWASVGLGDDPVQTGSRPTGVLEVGPELREVRCRSGAPRVHGPFPPCGPFVRARRAGRRHHRQQRCKTFGPGR